MIQIVKRKRARWMRSMVQDGVSPTLIHWALGEMADGATRPARPRLARGRGADRNAAAVSVGQAPSPSGRHAARPRTPSPRERAVSALKERVVEDGEALFLDGVPVDLRDIVVAALACGADIPYPGIRPVPQAYHSGPSYTVASKKKRRRGQVPESHATARPAVRPW